MKTITNEQARQFILLKQGLIGTYRFIGKDGAYEYVRQAGCIQYDPVDVCGKNAELTLQSRVKGFKKSMLQDLLYKDRKLVDYADKELSIWPTEDWPYFSSYRDRSNELGDTFEGLAELEEQAISYIKENGPVSSDTPAVKRKYGYYTLPILYGDKFVGRIEAIPDRKEGILRVKGLWWEDGIRQTKKLSAALERTLKNFAKFNDCILGE